MKIIGIFCLLIPFVFSTLEVQAFVTRFVSESWGQLIAYMNVCLVMAGGLIFLAERQAFSKITKIWLLFLVCYYLIGMIATIVHGTPLTLSAVIPLVYFLGFSIFLSRPEHQKIFIMTAVIGFCIATVFVIVFHQLNFSIDYGGIHIYKLERADGLYGDANQAAVGCLLTIIFIYHFFQANTKFHLILKALLLMVSVYALILTFSKTGFLILIIISALTFYKLFTPKRILVSVFVAPLLIIAALNAGLATSTLSASQQQRLNDISNILTFNTEKVDFSGRGILLQNMLNYVYDNPILGYGISFSNLIFGHNTIIGVWADAGIIPFLLFLYLILQYYSKAYSAPEEKRYFALSAVLILTVFMLSLQTIINQPYLIAILIYLGYYVENEKDIPTESLS